MYPNIYTHSDYNDYYYHSLLWWLLPLVIILLPATFYPCSIIMIIIIAIGIYTATTSHFYHTSHVHTYLNHSSTPADYINGTGTDLYITASSCISYLVFHVFFSSELYYYLYSALQRMSSQVKHFTVLYTCCILCMWQENVETWNRHTTAYPYGHFLIRPM